MSKELSKNKSLNSNQSTGTNSNRDFSSTFDMINKNLHDFFDSASDLILVLGLDGRILFANDSCKKALKYSEEELTSLKLSSIVHQYFKEGTFKNLTEVTNGQKPEKFNSIFVTKTGRKVHVSGSFSCNYENGNPIAFTGIFFDNTEKTRSENAQKLYYGISNLVIETTSLDNLLESIHKLLKQYIAANNFHLALYNEKENLLDFPYYVDEIFGGKVDAYKRSFSKGLTEYAIKKRSAVFLYEDTIKELVSSGEIQLYGPVPKVWLGVPLKMDNRIIGVISVKSHSDKNKYRKRELELLDFISGQIALTVERKRYEDKINKQRAKLNAIFESSTHLIWSINKKWGLTSFNQNYARIVIEKYGTVPVLDPDGVNRHFILAEKSQKVFVEEKYKLAFEGQPQHFEVVIKNSEEEETWREVFLNPIFLPDGTIEEVSGISHDITQKKLSDIAIKDSERKFRHIFESFQDIYYRTNLRGVIKMISPSVKEVAGYSQEEVFNKNVNKYFEAVMSQKSLLRKLFREGQVRNYEAKLVTKSGDVLQVTSNLRLIYNWDNKPVAVDGVIRDITYLQEAADELRKAKNLAEHSLKVKEQFLANMSHEIRTPMNGITGMIDLLSGTPMNVEQTDYVDTIKKSSKILLEILNDILDLSKLEAGKMELKPTPINLKYAVEEIHALFEARAKEKDIAFNYHIKKNVPKYIEIDETRLLQILSNLSSNAIKFTEDGSVSIFVSQVESTSDHTVLKFEVTDTGIGIEKEDMDRLFKNFNQLDNSMTKSYSGTGLGLAISKELTRLMQGEISLKSTVGIGSTFCFTIKAKLTTKQQVDKQLSKGMSAFSEHAFEEIKPYILLVDDNKTNRKVATTILQKADCVVDEAVDGYEAIEKVENNDKRYDLIFMDIQMPKLDGISAFKEIKKLHKKDTPPVIAMTAYSMKEDEEKIRKSGMDDYLPKPITSDSLLRKVGEWVQNKGEHVHVSEKKEEEGDVVFVDGNIVNQLRDIGGEELVDEIFESFETETQELLDESVEGLNSQEFEVVRSHMHTIKGSAGTIGLKKIARKAEILEKQLKAKDYSNIQVQIDEILNDFHYFKKNLNKIIK